MSSSIAGHWGVPPDSAAMVAAAAGVGLLVLARPFSRSLSTVARRASQFWIAGVALLAAVLSIGYWHFYLRGGPRIIDATYYWLQAKTFANGLVSLPLLWPTAALRGRFLHYALDAQRLSVLFPPGYAAVLAVGAALKVPQLVGPLVALLLVVSTAGLAKRAFNDQRAAIIAAALSALCVALRYHTADTLSHGWAALLFVVATWSALGRRYRDHALCGLCWGWLWATRPVSAIALFAVIVFLRRRLRWREWLIWGLAALPGLIGWLAYQRITTGSWFQTTQYAYYALADGPAGCFRYGFGAGIGCHYEHGDYVAKRLPHSYGWVAALTVSAVRLRWHLLDVFNFEPLMIPLLFAARASSNKSVARVLLCAPALLLLVYAPFYFDGNFPGGGARLLADAIPLEHALISGWLAQRARWPIFFGFSLLGFGTHAAFEHELLRAREGGHPMFEARTLRQAGITHGLILVNTDHGFALGHEPGWRDAKQGLVVARAHRDAHDWALWKALGEPTTFYYTYDAAHRDARPAITAAAFESQSNLRFQAEAEWPVVGREDAWATPGFPPCPCVSDKRALIVHPSGPRSAVELALYVPKKGRYRVRVGWVTMVDVNTRLKAVLDDHSWILQPGSERFRCESEAGPTLALAAGEHVLRIEVGQRLTAIDWFQLEPAD